jgi:CubicO group peptidase (beta-lactamase class C family)
MLYGRSTLALLATACLLLQSGGRAAAEPEAPAQVQPAAQAQPQKLTQEDAGAWLDGFMPLALAEADIAGAVVVIVKDGQVLLERGYGYANVDTLRPVDPRRTLFRPGSISKLFTWTSVMQLVEAQQLDLDQDVNRYLDFTVPPFQGQPITLRQLMTHTAGFEEATKYLFAGSPSDLLPLGEYLKAALPVRVYAPGSTPAYSNYGATLAGYIVERVSGQSFADYVEQHIFVPLAMDHSTFRQPLSNAFLPDMSQGYDKGSAPSKPFELLVPAPAGALAASGDDIAHFMIAQLQDGRYGDARILKPETAQLMHATANQAVPPLDGMDLGFYEDNINGHRVIEHGGDTIYFHSNLSLFADDGVGLYLSMNSAGNETARYVRGQLFERFADRYFPGALPPAPLDAAVRAAHAAMIAGHYEISRRSVTGFLAIGNLFNQAAVAVNEDGTISDGAKLPDGEPKHYQEIAPFIWRQVDGHDRLAAIVKDGAIERFSREPLSGIIVWDRVPLAHSAAWLAPAAGTGFAILLMTALSWPLNAVLRRRYGASFALAGARARGYRLSRLGAVGVTVALVLFLMVLSLPGAGIGLFALIAGRLDIVLHACQLVLLIALIGSALAMLDNLATVWRQRTPWTARLWSVALVLGLASIIWTVVVFNVLNPDLRF